MNKEQTNDKQLTMTKPVVPSFVMEYYQTHKLEIHYVKDYIDSNLLLTSSLGQKVWEWLYNTYSRKHNQRMFAFITLITLGERSVEIKD